MNKNKNKGFTLIELLIGVSFVSIASVSTYHIASYANDFRTIKSEVSDLSEFIKSIENTTNTTVFNDEAIQTFQKFKSNLELSSITSKNGNLLLNYSNAKTRICVDFVSKMISAKKNIFAIINGKDISKNDLNEISNSCFSNQNELSIVVNKSQSYTINTITASVNPPPPAHNDVVIPEIPVPIPVPTVPAFTPSTAQPITYGITGIAPVYPVVAPSGGPIAITPGTTTGTVKPPIWTPPPFNPAGPATPRPADDIDQNPLPPPPPPAPPAGISIVKGNTLNVCKRYVNGSVSVGTFRWMGNKLYGNEQLYTPNEYYAKYGNFGEFWSSGASSKQNYDEAIGFILKPSSQYTYKCTDNGSVDYANW